jgi:hypothetical protein
MWIDLHYLPCVAYFEKIKNSEKVTFEMFEHYTKQTYKNRCTILTAQGKIDLSIPIIHHASKMPFCEVKIDYKQKWQRNHWRTIKTAYGNAPFFIYYSEIFENIFQQEIKYLYEWNLHLIKTCFKILKLNVEIDFTETYNPNYLPKEEDFRNYFLPKNNHLFKTQQYLQVFQQEYVHNLSILDLIFCEGSLKN